MCVRARRSVAASGRTPRGPLHTPYAPASETRLNPTQTRPKPDLTRLNPIQTRPKPDLTRLNLT
eukprot:9280778-Pyramimonas_sp.AAC.1